MASVVRVRNGRSAGTLDGAVHAFDARSEPWASKVLTLEGPHLFGLDDLKASMQKSDVIGSPSVCFAA